MNINKLTGGVDGANKRQNVDETDTGKNNSAKQVESSESSTKTDSVKLSSQTQLVQQIEAEVNQLPDIDDKTIDRIKDQLAKGEYKIDYQRLADKIINFEDIIN